MAATGMLNVPFLTECKQYQKSVSIKHSIPHLCTFYVWSNLILQTPLWVWFCFIGGDTKRFSVKVTCQTHRATQWQRWDWNPGWLSGSHLFLPGHHTRKLFTWWIVLLWSLRMGGMDSNFLCEQAVLDNLLRKRLYLVFFNIYIYTSFTVHKNK